MAEEFLTLMADIDDDSQQILSGGYEEIKKAVRCCVFGDMFLRSSHMKKIVLLPALIVCAFCFGEVFTKKIEVDEIYRIEMTYDSGTGILDMNMLAKNTTVFDEPYAEEQMQAALDDFISCDATAELLLSAYAEVAPGWIPPLGPLVRTIEKNCARNPR